MKYQFIREDRLTYDGQLAPPKLERYCEALDGSESGYYDFRRRLDAPSARTRENAKLTEEIHQIFDENNGWYGAPRVTAQLRKDGWKLGRKRVYRIMHSEQLRGRTRRRFRVTTCPNDRHQPSPNRLAERVGGGWDRRFLVPGPNQVWLIDITYLPIGPSWLYFTAILDLASRRIVGWAFSHTLEARYVQQAIQQAVMRRGVAPGLMLHSDRGSQFTAEGTRELLTYHGLTQSMSSTGNCFDNAPMESFFKTLKAEALEGKRFETPDEAVITILDYIELYYNERRLHSSLGYQSPNDWERNYLHINSLNPSPQTTQSRLR